MSDPGPTIRDSDEQPGDLPAGAYEPDPDADPELLVDAVGNLKTFVDALVGDPANLNPDRCRKILALVDAIQAELDQVASGED